MLVGDREKKLRLTRWLIHLLGISGILAAGALYHVVVSALIAHKQQAIAAEVVEKEQFLDRAEAIRAEHQQLTKQLALLESNAVTMRQRIPEQPRESEFLKQITQAADEAGLKIQNYERGPLDRKATHSEFQVNLACEGDYESIVGFLDRLAHLPRVASVQTLNLAVGETEIYPFHLSLLLYYGAQTGEAKRP